MTIKTLLLTPSSYPRLTGNAVTVERIARGLSQEGVACLIIDLGITEEQTIVAAVADFRPDIIHNFHAFKAGPTGLQLKENFPQPMITTMTGTDVNIDIYDARKSPEITAVLAASDRITVFNGQARQNLVALGFAADKIDVIHQSVSLPPQEAADFAREFNITGDELVFLSLGGIRKVKAITFAVDVLEEVQNLTRNLVYIIAGPMIEEVEGERLRRRIDGREWIRLPGPIPREKISALFGAVDVFINTSVSESESNAILEAMYHAKPVVARAIAGNASLVNDETGVLFFHKNDLKAKIMELVADEGMIRQKGRKGRDQVLERFDFHREITSYLSLYRRLLRAQPRF